MGLFDFALHYLLGVTTITQICNRPDAFPDDPYSFDLNCDVLSGSYSDQVIPDGDPVIMEYNIEDGTNWRDILAEITKLDTQPSIIMIEEADRGCDDTEGLFILEEMAKSLKMDYAYGVEFLRWEERDDNYCTTGNGILSKYPLTNARMMTFEKQCCWFSGRLGGRNAVIADTVVNGVNVRIMETHLESGTALKDQIASALSRQAQATQLANDAKAFDGAKFLAGDLNTPFLELSGTVNAIIEEGFTDAFKDIPFWKRTSVPEEFGFCLDYMFSSNNCLKDATIGTQLKGLSDHLPLMATLDMECHTSATSRVMGEEMEGFLSV